MKNLRRPAGPRSHWLFIKPCQCPVGLVESFRGETDSEGLAWDAMYEDDPAGERQARRAGVTVILVSHEVYEKDWFEKMFIDCRHG